MSYKQSQLDTIASCVRDRLHPEAAESHNVRAPTLEETVRSGHHTAARSRCTQLCGIIKRRKASGGLVVRLSHRTLHTTLHWLRKSHRVIAASRRMSAT
jgi:hypothetical protein